MSIRWQNIFSIVPIFLLVGLVSGWLRLNSDQQELLWGFQEQGAGVAASMAAFLDGDRWQALSKQDKAAAAETQERLERIFHFGSVRQVFGLSDDGKQVVFNLAPADGIKDRPAVDAETLAKVQNGESVVSDIASENDGVAKLFAFSPINNADKKMEGIVGVVVRADDYQRAWTASLHQAAWLCAGVTALGLIVSLILSSVFCARLRDLEKAADALAAGQFDAQLEPGLVRELSDLSDTFNTVGSILGELAEKSRQSVVEAEQFRTEEDLKSTYSAQFYPGAWLESDRLQIAACLANPECAGDFFEIFDTSYGTYALFGSVTAGKLSDQMVQASAAHAMSRELLRHMSVEEAWQRVSGCFSLAHWECVFISKHNGEAQNWRLSADKKGLIHEKLGEVGGPRVFHTLSKQAAEKIETYLACVPGITAEELLSEIRPFLRQEKNGAAVIVGDFSVPS